MAPRQRVLTDSEIALIWQATKGIYPAGPFARFLLLTAVRRNEAARMTWSEVDLDNALWVIPAHRTKSGTLHEVPLSGMAIDLLRSLPRLWRRLRIFDHRRPYSDPEHSAGSRTQSMSASPSWRHRADQLAFP